MDFSSIFFFFAFLLFSSTDDDSKFRKHKAFYRKEMKISMKFNDKMSVHKMCVRNVKTKWKCLVCSRCWAWLCRINYAKEAKLKRTENSEGKLNVERNEANVMWCLLDLIILWVLSCWNGVRPFRKTGSSASHAD